MDSSNYNIISKCKLNSTDNAISFGDEIGVVRIILVRDTEIYIVCQAFVNVHNFSEYRLDPRIREILRSSNLIVRHHAQNALFTSLETDAQDFCVQTQSSKRKKKYDSFCLQFCCNFHILCTVIPTSNEWHREI